MATHSSTLAWKIQAAVHGVTKSRTRLRDLTFTFHFHALEKEMVTHSSVLAWRIPRTGEPGGLPSMRLHRVGHDGSDLAVAAVGEGQQVDELGKDQIRPHPGSHIDDFKFVLKTTKSI